MWRRIAIFEVEKRNEWGGGGSHVVGTGMRRKRGKVRACMV